MNTVRFEYMLDLEKTGNISKTAENFYISASAVSQCLKKEESELGYKIFSYSNHRMVPTSQGRIYLDGAREILAIKRDTYEKLQISQRTHDRIRIAVTPLLYELFRDRLPAISQDALDVFPAGSRVGTEYILSRFADLAVTCSGSPHARASVCKQVILRDRMVLVVPKEYLKSYAHDTPTIRDCETIPFILLKSASLMRVIEEEILAKSHISSPRIYEVDDFSVARSYLLEGRGASFLPAAFLPEGGAERFYVIETTPVRSIYFAILYLHTASPQIKGLAERIADEAAKAVL